MSNNKKVALIGWNPDVLDYKNPKRLGFTAEKLRAVLENNRDKVKSLGYDAELLYINSANTAKKTVSDALKTTKYDCILIAAGVRTLPEHLFVFEQLINIVHQQAASAKICFNTNPNDTAEAIERWLE